MCFQVFEEANYLRFLNSREIHDEFINRRLALDVIEESLNWHTGSLEDRCATHDFRINLNFREHGVTLAEAPGHNQRLPRHGESHKVRGWDERFNQSYDLPFTNRLGVSLDDGHTSWCL